MAWPTLSREQLSTFEPRNQVQYEGLNAGTIIENAGIQLLKASAGAGVVVSSLVAGVSSVFRNTDREIMEREALISEEIAAQIEEIPVIDYSVERAPIQGKPKREIGEPGIRPVGAGELDAAFYTDEEAIRFLESNRL